jgi:SlyX protein
VNEADERLRRLEEKIAYLERHVTEQDRAMLEFSRAHDALRRELKTLRERGEPRATGAGEPGGETAADERPPHY